MSENKSDELLHDHNNDDVNRRGFLKCMAWAGTGRSSSCRAAS